VIAGRHYAAQDVAQFRLVVDEAQQRFTARPALADAEDVFGRRVQADDEQVTIEEDDAGTEAVEDIGGFARQCAIVAGTTPAGGGARRLSG